MSGLELNKFAASVLLAGLIAMIVGTVADVLYYGGMHSGHPESAEMKRGYQIDVAIGDSDITPVEEEVEVIDIVALMSVADPAAGEKLYKRQCASCHGVDKGGKHKVGPNLWDVVGMEKAHHADFNYSSVLAGMEGVWTYENLFYFLKRPRDYAKGTKMTYAGFKKKNQDNANVIAYLRAQSDNPAPLP